MTGSIPGQLNMTSGMMVGNETGISKSFSGSFNVQLRPLMCGVMEEWGGWGRNEGGE